MGNNGNTTKFTFYCHGMLSIGDRTGEVIPAPISGPFSALAQSLFALAVELPGRLLDDGQDGFGIGGSDSSSALGGGLVANVGQVTPQFFQDPDDLAFVLQAD